MILFQTDAAFPRLAAAEADIDAKAHDDVVDDSRELRLCTKRLTVPSNRSVSGTEASWSYRPPMPNRNRAPTNSLYDNMKVASSNALSS